MAANTQKPEVRIRHIMGGMLEAIETNEYPNYYLFRSRKYKKTWRFKEMPVDLKFKGEIVYSVKNDFEVYDVDGQPIVDIDTISEMRH